MTFNPFQNKPLFLHVCSTSLLKTLRENEKLLVKSNFSFSHSVFYPLGHLYAIFHQIQNCRLQTLSVSKTLKFVLWERINPNVPVICCLQMLWTWTSLNSLLNDKFSTKYYVTEKLKLVFRRVERIAGKGENAGYHNFFKMLLILGSCVVMS